MIFHKNNAKDIKKTHSLKNKHPNSLFFKYLFNFCKCDPFFEPESNSSIYEETSKNLINEHYNNTVCHSLDKPQIKETKWYNSNNSLLKSHFQISPDLRLYNNMHILLTFHTNRFFLTWGRSGIIAKIGVQLIKIDNSYYRMQSYENFNINPPTLHENSIISAKNSISNKKEETSIIHNRRSNELLKEIIHSFAKKTIINTPLILDLSDNEGKSAMIWANEGANVIIIEESPLEITKIKANIMLSGEKFKIDVINGKIEGMLRIKANMVFLQLKCDFSEEDIEAFSIKKLLLTQLKVNIRDCLGIAENLVFLLPNYCNLDEIAEIFRECFQENEMFDY